MKVRHPAARALASLAGGALLLSACSTGSSSDTSTDTGETTVITAGYEQEFSAYNNSTSGNATTKNQIVLNQVLPSFWEFGDHGDVKKLSDFGSYEKTSDSPLTVEYTISDKAIWSDDTPIDCSDVVLQWAAQSGKFPDAGFDPASTSGFDKMQQPKCAAGDKKFTIVYNEPFADWIAGIGGPTQQLMPAHVIERETGVASVIDAVTDNNAADLKKIADFWNTAWSFSPGELKKDIIPSSGPYQIDSWKAGESITLKANPKWWGAKPKAGTIVIRFIPQQGQAQALQNGEIQVAEPQPNPDVLNQLAKAGDQITVLKGDEFTYDHLTFNFNGQFKDETLRKAFALCVPRDEIVEKLVKPVNPDAKVLESRLLFPFQAGYDEYASTLGAEQYDKPNLAEATKLMAGRPTVTVRLGHIDPNQRRTDTTQLIKASCDKVGFNVVDSGSTTFHDDGGGLDAGNFDVALFAWSGSSLVTGNTAIYMTNGGQNKGHYSNPQVDQWLTQLEQSTDPDQQRELFRNIDKQLWTDLATIPLFAWPGVVAHSSDVTGVSYQPAQTGVEWNVQQWAVKS